MFIHYFTFKPRTTNQRVNLFIPAAFIAGGSTETEAGVPSHEGKTGLAYDDFDNTNQGSYRRDGETADTEFTIATATLGTWVSAGFVLIDDTNMPGVYEFGIPNACLLGGGAKFCDIILPFALTVAATTVRIHIDLIRSIAY